MYVCMIMCLYRYVCVCMCVYICMCVYMCVYVYMHILTIILLINILFIYTLSCCEQNVHYFLYYVHMFYLLE